VKRRSLTAECNRPVHDLKTGASEVAQQPFRSRATSVAMDLERLAVDNAGDNFLRRL
jgi:hypothetical protein